MLRSRTTSGSSAPADRGRKTLAAALSAVFRHVDDGILILYDDQRVASINRFLAEAAGVTESEVVGQSATRLIRWSDADAGTQDPVPTTVILETVEGARECPTVVLPFEREDGLYLRILIIHAASGTPFVETGDGLSKFERQIVDGLRRPRGAETDSISGQIEVVMLDAVKQRLGERWRQLSEKVMNLAARLIDKRLKTGESCARIADSSFLIAFAGANVDDAARRAEAIATEIHQLLLGDTEAAGNFVVKGTALPVANTEPRQTDGAFFRPEDRSRQHIDAGLHLRVSASRDAYLERVEKGLTALIHDARLSHVAFRRRGTPEGVLMADLDADSRARVSALNQVGIHAHTHPEIGLLPFVLTIDHLYRTVDSPRKPPPVLAVPLTMLMERQGIERFLTLARPLPPALRKQLMLVMAGLERGTARQRLTEIAQRVIPFCRRVAVAIEGLDDSPVAYEEFRPAGIILQWSAELERETRQGGERLHRLVARAHRHNCLVILKGGLDTERHAHLEGRFAVDMIIDENTATAH